MIFDTIHDDKRLRALYFYFSFDDLAVLSRSPRRLKSENESCIFSVSSHPVEFSVCRFTVTVGQHHT